MFKGMNSYMTGDKSRYFHNDGAGWLAPGNPEAAKKWREEFEACRCNRCHDQECKWRDKNERWPLDVAGGQNQCIRMMEAKTPFTWRNGDGTVIAIPLDVVEAIRNA